MSRNKDLIYRRNKAIFKLYYQLAEVECLRYDKVLSILSERYFISEFTTAQIIRKMIRESGEMVKVHRDQARNITPVV